MPYASKLRPMVDESSQENLDEASNRIPPTSHTCHLIRRSPARDLLVSVGSTVSWRRGRKRGIDERRCSHSRQFREPGF